MAPALSSRTSGLFQPILTLAKAKSKTDLSAGPDEGRSETNNLLLLKYKPPRGPMPLGCPRIPGILAPQGRHLGSGCHNRQTPSSGLAFVAISERAASIHGTCYPPLSRASGFCLLSRWLLAVPRGDGRATGLRTVRIESFGNVARTISCTSPAGREEQISHHHGEQSSNQRHMRHIRLRSPYVPHVNPRGRFYLFFPLSRRMVHDKMANGNIPHPRPPMAFPSQGENTRGHTL